MPMIVGYLPADALGQPQHQNVEFVSPNDERHQLYRTLYEQAYPALQAPLRQASHTLPVIPAG